MWQVVRVLPRRLRHRHSGTKRWRSIMYPLAAISSGLLATVGVVSLAVSGPASLGAVSSRLTSTAADTAGQVDRSHKGDRLAINKSADGQAQRNVATVEGGGVWRCAI